MQRLAGRARTMAAAWRLGAAAPLLPPLQRQRVRAAATCCTLLLLLTMPHPRCPCRPGEHTSPQACSSNAAGVVRVSSARAVSRECPVQASAAARRCCSCVLLLPAAAAGVSELPRAACCIACVTVPAPAAAAPHCCSSLHGLAAAVHRDAAAIAVATHVVTAPPVVVGAVACHLEALVWKELLLLWASHAQAAAGSACSRRQASRAGSNVCLRAPRQRMRRRLGGTRHRTLNTAARAPAALQIDRAAPVFRPDRCTSPRLRATQAASRPCHPVWAALPPVSESGQASPRCGPGRCGSPHLRAAGLCHASPRAGQR